MTTPSDVRNAKFSAMCQTVGSGDHSKFPLELPFTDGKAAQSFRCEFYAYRRTLQKDPATQFDPDRIIELEGANALEIARVDYVNTPSVLTIRLRMQRPAFQKAYNVLDGLFEEQAQKLSIEFDPSMNGDSTATMTRHTITTTDGTYQFFCHDNPPRSDAMYLLQIKRGTLEATFIPLISAPE